MKTLDATGEIHLETDDGRPVLILVPPNGIPCGTASTFIKAIARLMREMPEATRITVRIEA